MFLADDTTDTTNDSSILTDTSTTDTDSGLPDTSAQYSTDLLALIEQGTDFGDSITSDELDADIITESTDETTEDVTEDVTVTADVDIVPTTYTIPDIDETVDAPDLLADDSAPISPIIIYALLAGALIYALTKKK